MRIFVALPVLVVLAHLGAITQGAAIDWVWVHLAAVAAAVGGVSWGGRGLEPGGRAWRSVAWCGSGFLIWQAIHVVLAQGPMRSTASDRLALDALCLAVVLLVGRRAGSTGFSSVVVGMAAAVFLALAGASILSSVHVGFGMVNHLFAIAVPILIAGCVDALMAGRCLSFQGILSCSAVLLLIIFAYAAVPGMPRRTGLLAILVGAAVPFLFTVRHRRVAMAIGILACLAIAAYASWAFSQTDVLAARTQRLSMWAVAWEGAMQALPCGGGVWNCLRLEECLPGPTAAAMAGTVMDHPHNEFLAALLDFGVPGLAFHLVFAWVLFAGACRMSAGPSRGAVLAALASGVVVLSLDNAMSMPAGRLSAAVGTGVLLSMIEEGKEIFGSRDRWRIATWSPWLAAGGGLWVLATLLPAGWASRPLSQADCMSICGRTPMPQAVVTALVLTRERADVATLPDRLRAIDVASARFGAATPLLIERYQTIRSMLVSGRASGGPWGGLAVGDLPDALAETGQCLVRSNPFLIQPYFDLLSMPKHRVVIDPVLQRRLEILRQVPEGAPARPPMPGGIDDLADTWLHLVSRRVHGRADAWDDGQEMEIRRRLPWIPKVSDAAGILRAMAVHPGERQAGGTVR